MNHKLWTLSGRVHMAGQPRRRGCSHRSPDAQTKKQASIEPASVPRRLKVENGVSAKGFGILLYKNSHKSGSRHNHGMENSSAIPAH